MKILGIEFIREEPTEEEKRQSDIFLAFALGTALMAVVDLIKYGV